MGFFKITEQHTCVSDRSLKQNMSMDLFTFVGEALLAFPFPSYPSLYWNVDQTILHSPLWFLSLSLAPTTSSSQAVSQVTCTIWRAEVVGDLVKDKTAATGTLSRMCAGFVSGPQHAQTGLFSSMSLLFFLSFLRETLDNYSFMKQCLFKPAFICTLHLISLFSLLSCSICKVAIRRISKKAWQQALRKLVTPSSFLLTCAVQENAVASTRQRLRQLLCASSAQQNQCIIPFIL